MFRIVKNTNNAANTNNDDNNKTSSLAPQIRTILPRLQINRCPNSRGEGSK
ncbi:MAG: hypothetical protein ACI87E_003660 [Mariniblastus sp.]|jgi:hypothetical protein